MSEFFEALPRRIFIACLAIVCLIGAFSYGALAHRNALFPMPQLKTAYGAVFVQNALTASPKQHHLQPSRGQGDGVTRNQLPDDGSLVLLSGFFDEQNQIRLIRRDGTLVRKWGLDYFEHFPDAQSRICDLTSPLNTDVHGVHVTPGGEVVFNYEYCGSVKLDPCGGIVWTIDKPTHHTLVPAEAGGYWLLGRQTWQASDMPNRFAPFSTAAQDHTMLEDTLMRISEGGDILEEVSIPELMRENGLEAVLTANGNNFSATVIERTELVHANKVAELPSDIADAFTLFDAGDLALSMRQLNLIMVLDPVTKRVKWHQTGPWLRQHDPEFRPDGRISVFNNNVYRTAYADEQTVLSSPFRTNIIAVDPITRQSEILFGEKPGQEMLSVIRGQHELLAHDGILITEFDAGRVIEVNADRDIVWEYVNRYDDDFVGEVINAAVYPDGYFRTEWKACAP